MGEKIVLEDTSNADSRTSKGITSLAEVYRATKTHQGDVRRVMNYYAELLNKRGKSHDWTKTENFDEEYGFLVTNNIRDEEFIESEWWWRHIRLERHHCKEYAHKDVNLIDILEMIADRVTAEKGRTGIINMEYLDLNPIILIRAYYNTIIMTDEKTELKK